MTTDVNAAPKTLCSAKTLSTAIRGGTFVPLQLGALRGEVEVKRVRRETTTLVSEHRLRHLALGFSGGPMREPDVWLACSD